MDPVGWIAIAFLQGKHNYSSSALWKLGCKSPQGTWLSCSQESEVVLVPALPWLLTKPIFCVAPRVAFPTFETERRGQQQK